MKKRDELVDFEALRRRMDGTERWVSINSRPIRFDDQDCTMIWHFDITERKRAENILRENEQRLRDYADASADWFWEMDSDLRFTYLSGNVERIVGVAPEWHYGKTREDLLGDGFDSDVWDEHLKTLQEHEPFRNFEYLRAGDASVDAIWIRTSGVPVFAADGAFLGYRGTGSDITERKQTEEQLRQAQKMEAVGQLTGGVAHDFNNLLAVVLGNLEMAREALGDDSDVSGLVGRASAAALRGATLTDRLLAFSRKQALTPGIIDLNELVAGMTDLLHRTLGEMVEIETVSAGGLWRCEADWSQMDNALLNLAINARDAMPDGGKLTIETGNVDLGDDDLARADAAPGHYVMVAVTDTGAGMARHVIDHAFEPFFTTKDVGGGSGLGLSMIHGFAKQSGGHVTIYSEEGHGATVKMYLPRSHAGAEQARHDEREATLRARGETILVVEDDADVRALAVALLGSLGYGIIEAADGESALAALDKASRVDLLFTDVVLPGGMNGSKLVEEARRRERCVPVIFTSGYTDNAIIHQGRLDEGVEFLKKPYRKADLAQKIRSVLDEADS